MKKNSKTSRTHFSLTSKSAGRTSLCVLAKTGSVADNSPPMSEAGNKSKSNSAVHAIRIAVVEDDEWVRNGMADQINDEPQFQCISRHGSGEEAVKELPKSRPDVILMDINLPGMNGIECVRRLKEALPDANILMLTVYEESDKIFDSLKAGASGYLLKRTPQKELMEAIVHVHVGGSPMTGLIARKVVQYFKQRSSPSELETLSAREREILERLGEGAAYKEIADALRLSIDTVRMHIRGIYRKLHVHSRGEAVAKFLRR